MQSADKVLEESVPVLHLPLLYEKELEQQKSVLSLTLYPASLIN